MAMSRIWLPNPSFQQDLATDRPAAGPGVFGLFWYSTDSEAWSWCDGISWIPLGGGGGGGGTLTATHETCDVTGQVIPTDAQTQLTWGHHGGATLLDYTDPTTPVIVGDGAYTADADLYLDSTYVGKVGVFFVLATLNGGTFEYDTGSPSPLDLAVDASGLNTTIPLFDAVGGTDVLIAFFTHNVGSDVTVELFATITKWTIT